MAEPQPKSPDPPRPGSTSSARRRSATGLPPKHIAHLRSLVRQWIPQQKKDFGGIPGGPAFTSLWSETRAKEIEDAISKGLLTGQSALGQQGLLDIDWADWAARSSRRRDTWKQEQTDLAKRKQKETVDRSTLRFLKRASQSDADVPKRGRQLSVGTPTAIPSMLPSTVSTPVRQPSRPASIASSLKSAARGDEFTDKLTAGLFKTMTTASDGSGLSDENLHSWCARIKTMKGYEPLKNEKRDEWEVVRGTQPRSSIQIVPGAFPQGDQHHLTREPSEPSPTTATDATKDCSMLKPVFCVQFASTPPPSTTASNASTVRFRERSSGSVGSNAAWWTSGKRQSEMTIRGGEEQDFEIKFIPGQFALPTIERKSSSVSATDQLGTSATSSAADTLGRASSRSESWSDSDETGKPGNDPVNLIIVGSEDDVPLDGKEGEVGLAGGTFVVKGMGDSTQRSALAQILQYLLYSIHSMKLELELLDAFRIPRETESPFPNNAHLGPLKADIVRRSSMQGAREKRGFFGRLVGRETREVLDNIFRPHRSRLGQNGITDDPLPKTRQRSPSLDDLGLESPPMGIVADRSLIPGIESADPLSSTPSREKTIFPEPPNTNLQLLANMQKIKVSTTPGMVVPPPTLLQRADDEDKNRESTNASAQSALGLLFGDDIPPSVRLDDQPSSQRSGGDVRVGLKAIRSDIDTFEGWSHFQRLETLRCTTVDDPQSSDTPDAILPTICQKPQPETFVFYDHDHDASVLDILRGLEAEMEDLAACARSGCVATAHDHLRCWYHCNKKVILRAEKSVVEKEESDEDDMTLETWASCSTCNSSTEPKKMSDGGSCYSWGKLMELLIYTDTLRAGSHCSHPPTLHFRNAGVVATVSVESFTVLDMRLPQLQVGPNVNKRKPGKEAAEAVLETLSNGQVAMAREKVQAQLTDYNQSVAKVLIHLDNLVVAADKVTFDPEAKTKPEWTPDERADKLRLMGFDVQRLQLELDAEIAQIPSSRLNDARILIASHHKKMEQMFASYLKDNKIPGSLSDAPFALPDFVEGEVHALPGGSLLVREDDPSSVIAYTLSSLAYYKELSGTKKIAAEVGESTNTTDTASGWKVEIRRKDNVQDLFTLRNITKKQSDVSATPSKPPAMAVTQTMPSLELSLEQVHGQSESHDHLGDLVKSINKAACQDPMLAARTDSPHFSSRNASPSLASWHEDGPVDEDDGWGSPRRSVKRRSGIDHLLPEAVHPISRSVSIDGQSVPITPNTSAGLGTPTREEGWGSMTSNFTSALFKMGTGVGETLGSFRMKGGERSLSSMLGPLSSMSQTDNALANSGVNRLPHLVFTYTLGEKRKLSCTVYFAEAFDSLRRRCAIEKAMIESLSEVENWDASGGKSKAAFFMTKDKRFIVKELVAGWIGSDTNAMLELAPEYFRYMQSTHNKATSLVKIAGFFSVTIQDRTSGSKRSMDLLVMENLFYKHEISKTYDLKGIEGRKVAKTAAPSGGTAEAKAVGSTTLWDGDWLDSIARRPVLLYPHAKRILTEAIAMDTKFLAAQSVMDYSLLLGLDKGQKELVVGIVDSIGSYDLWKTIESKGKLLTRGGEVTVVPPGQYKERFETALNKYFLACPDKWSKPSPGESTTRNLGSFL